MKSYTFRSNLVSGTLLSFLMSILFVQATCYSQGLEGNWYGLLDINGDKIRIQYVVDENDSRWNAKLLSPDQTSQEFACDEVVVTRDSVIFQVNSMHISFRGKRMKDDLALSGNLIQGENVTPLILTKNEVSKPVRFRPQNPVEPFPYRVETVSFTNKKAGINLSGTLTYPEGKGLFPAVVLISGSGPQDRDETMLDHKPFWVLADYLTRQGFAVLRYDDRGVGASKGNFQTSDSRDFAEDAVAALEFLESKSFIDPAKTGLAGHSEGGYVAPMAAVMSDKVDFVISLAGSGIPGKDVLHRQTIDVEKMEGLSPEQAEKDARKNDDIFEILKNNPDSAITAKLLFEYLDKNPGSYETTSEQFMDYKEYHNAFFNSPWIRFFAFHNPADDWSKVTCPVLAINGDKDLQVNADENLSAIADALEKGGNTNYKTIKYAGLNHLFQPTEYGRVSEYENIDITIDPEVLSDISKWLKEICQLN